MKPLVARLTATQMTDIAVYIATLPRADAPRHFVSSQRQPPVPR
jgi:hypothetical protein